MSIRLRRRIAAGLACALAAAGLPGPSRADSLDQLLRALGDSAPVLNLRLRSETVDQNGLADRAEALTLRGRLGLRTGMAWDTSLRAEADLMTPLVDRYNSTINRLTRYPVIADPENYALDRLQLANTSLPGTTLIVGRQRINLDDERFVGSVDFRQNEQTFDAVRVINRSIPRLTVDLTWLDRVNRIFTRRSPVGRFTGNSYIADVSYETPLGRIAAFGYLLSLNQAHADSTRSVGVRLAGHRPLGGLVLDYSGSYADQRPYADNTLHFHDHYYAGEVTATYARLTAGVGVEALGGDGVKGFSTPLATLHKYNGWADEFLTTPVNGLQDRYATATWSFDRLWPLDTLSATATHHDFRSDRLDIPYGTEEDVMLRGKWRRFTGMLAFADYSPDRLAVSARKLWAEVDYTLDDE